MVTVRSPTERRLQLRAAGFVPVPVIGKQPPLDEWQTKVETNDGEIKLWGKTFCYAKSTGLLTRLMPTLDIDIKISEAAEAVEALIRARFEDHGTILIRVGNPPKRAIPFRTETPFDKITANLIAPNQKPDEKPDQKLELLADGQQVVAFGIHKDTGKPYAWFGGEPGNVRREELPAIDETQARQLVDDAVELLIREYGYIRAKDRPKKKRTNGADPYADAVGDNAADWAYLTDNIHAGRELHDSLRDLAAKLTRSGMSAGAAVNFLYGLMDSSTAPHDERWLERRNDIPRLVETAEEKIAADDPGDNKAAADDPIQFIDISGWDDHPPPEREWAVEDRIPLRQTILFSGLGGIGKSILTLQLLVSTALDISWLDLPVLGGKGLYLGAEEEDAELQRRLSAIMQYHGRTFSDIRDRLFIAPYADKNAMLAAPNRNGLMVPTPLYEKLFKQACEIRPSIIVLDTLSDIFGGNENDRVQVAAFLALMRRLAMQANSSVIINSHPSLSGMNSGSGLSGSTGWHGKVRSQIYLREPTTEEQESPYPDSDLRLLEFRKNQYGRLQDNILLRWSDGLYLPVSELGSAEQLLIDQKIEDLFLRLLARFTKEGRSVTDRKGTSYAPAVFADEAEARKIKATNPLLRAAMGRLFEQGKIRVEEVGPASRRRSRLVVVWGGS
ncbi:RecA-family ATPase [Bradyrhizobium diazoefficiens]